MVLKRKLEVKKHNKMRIAFEAINVLRWHYGMIGQPKSACPPAVESIETAFGMALSMSDPADFECLCPVLVFNRWDPDILVLQTPIVQRGRLRLAAAVGLFLTDYSRLGMPWPMETVVALKRLAKLTKGYDITGDTWNDPTGASEPDGLYLEFFKPYGLNVNWPLADFLKQYKWARIRNEERVQNLLETMTAPQAVA